LLLLPLPVAAGQSRTFPETGQTSSNAFYDFWQAHGGLEIIGLPLSPTYVTDKDQVIQIYERPLMEWHPENDRANRVQLALLGALQTRAIAENDPKAPDERTRPARLCGANADCETFPTGHTVLGAFRDYWYTHGGVATFGYPLTEEFTGRTFDGGGRSYIVQYFERNRLEYHPEINGGTVVLGRLGALVWEGLKNDLPSQTNTLVPDYDSNLPYLNASGAPTGQTSPAPPAGGQPTTPTPGASSVSLISVQGNVPGGTASVSAQAAPNVRCSISYVNPAGIPTQAAGLDDKTTDANGAVSWSWQLDATAQGGNGLVTVTCGGFSASSGIRIG
jgi:hypothetical protein